MTNNESLTKAIRILEIINKGNKRLTSQDINGKLNGDLFNGLEATRSLLSLLTNGGIVTASRGRYGGYELRYPLDKLKLSDVDRCISTPTHTALEAQLRKLVYYAIKDISVDTVLIETERNYQ